MILLKDSAKLTWNKIGLPNTSVCTNCKEGSLEFNGQSQIGHLIKPFSLHSVQRTTSLVSVITLQLPLQSKHGTNLTPPHPSQPSLEIWDGRPSTKTASVPSSCNLETSSAPPIYLPFTNTLGTWTGVSTRSLSSCRNSACIDTSRSSSDKPKLRKMNLTWLQSSNVFLIPRKLVVYRTTLCSPAGGHFTSKHSNGPGFNLFTSTTGVVEHLEVLSVIALGPPSIPTSMILFPFPLVSAPAGRANEWSLLELSSSWLPGIIDSVAPSRLPTLYHSSFENNSSSRSKDAKRSGSIVDSSSSVVELCFDPTLETFNGAFLSSDRDFPSDTST